MPRGQGLGHGARRGTAARPARHGGRVGVAAVRSEWLAARGYPARVRPGSCRLPVMVCGSPPSRGSGHIHSWSACTSDVPPADLSWTRHGQMARRRGERGRSLPEAAPPCAQTGRDLATATHASGFSPLGCGRVAGSAGAALTKMTTRRRHCRPARHAGTPDGACQRVSRCVTTSEGPSRSIRRDGVRPHRAREQPDFDKPGTTRSGLTSKRGANMAGNRHPTRPKRWQKHQVSTGAPPGT